MKPLVRQAIDRVGVGCKSECKSFHLHSGFFVTKLTCTGYEPSGFIF